METRRKVVTVVFADVVESTALGERVDAETLRWAMQRWFNRMRDAVERHGGTVENYVGDAVMAVFGIPVAHEDDALRAVRAAAAMRDAVETMRAASIVSSLLEPGGAAVVPEEAFWAVRKVLEALARHRPLVFVVDDLHWAEPTFVELVEHVADWARDAPLLLLIMARPELLDSRPGRGGGKPNATSVLLEPLAEADAADLLAHLAGPADLGEGTAARILDVAEGNPLFVEELVALLADSGGGELPDAVPPTIQALLAARLDRLSGAARA